jgi:hypothetical protein
MSTFCKSKDGWLFLGQFCTPVSFFVVEKNDGDIINNIRNYILSFKVVIQDKLK